MLWALLGFALGIICGSITMGAMAYSKAKEEAEWQLDLRVRSLIDFVEREHKKGDLTGALTDLKNILERRGSMIFDNRRTDTWGG